MSHHFKCRHGITLMLKFEFHKSYFKGCNYGPLILWTSSRFSQSFETSSSPRATASKQTMLHSKIHCNGDTPKEHNAPFSTLDNTE